MLPPIYFPQSSCEVLMANEDSPLPLTSPMPSVLQLLVNDHPERRKDSHCYHFLSIYYVALCYISNTFSQQCRKKLHFSSFATGELGFREIVLGQRPPMSFCQRFRLNKIGKKVITWVLIRVLGTGI